MKVIFLTMLISMSLQAKDLSKSHRIGFMEGCMNAFFIMAKVPLQLRKLPQVLIPLEDVCQTLYHIDHKPKQEYEKKRPENQGLDVI